MKDKNDTAGMNKDYKQGPCSFGTSFPSTPASNVVSSGSNFGNKAAIMNVKNVPLTKPMKAGPKKFSARGK